MLERINLLVRTLDEIYMYLHLLYQIYEGVRGCHWLNCRNKDQL